MFYFNVEYIAQIESFIEIPVVEKLFEKLRIEGFFSIWNSKAPMKYFEDYDTGFLTLFRVYKIANSVPDSLLERGRKGSNYYFQLSDPYSSDVLCPVLSDKEYYKIKTELKSLLNSNNWLLYEYPINEMEDLLKIYPQEDYLEETDEEKYQEESNVYSDIKKIKEGPIEKSQYIQNERKMPTRKPEMAKSALINAKYLCEVNKVHKTFIYDKSGQDFMEAHHLIPMARYDDFKWSIDIPENIICLCPNCHRAIHKAKKEFKDKIIEEFYNKRKDLLLARGIDIDLDTLKKYYR